MNANNYLQQLKKLGIHIRPEYRNYTTEQFELLIAKHQTKTLKDNLSETQSNSTKQTDNNTHTQSTKNLNPLPPNNKPPTPFDGRNPYRRPPSHENNYYNNYINYRDYERDSGRNHQYQNTQKVKAVLNLIEILSPRDLFHLRNDIVKMLKNQNY